MFLFFSQGFFFKVSSSSKKYGSNLWGRPSKSMQAIIRGLCQILV